MGLFKIFLIFGVLDFWVTTSGTPTMSMTQQPIPPPDPRKIEKHVSYPNRHAHKSLISNVLNLILEEGLFFQDEESRKAGPYDHRNESELKQIIDFSLSEEGVDDCKIVEIFKNVVKHSPHPAHPYMLDKRMSGLDPFSLVGDWLAAVMNVNVVTFLISPVASIMEKEMVTAISKLIGWNRRGQGTPCPGGAYANSMALSLAISHKFNSDFKKEGLFGRAKHPLVYVSEHASYSFNVLASYQGLGQTQIVRVKTDGMGRMDLDDLMHKIHKGANDDKYFPSAVVATVGTQVLGQIDNLERIAAICKNFSLWFHVDAEKGGGLLFKPGGLKGMDKADSVTFGTWMFSTPYVTTMFLTKNETALEKSFGLHAPYVFTGQDLYDMSYDTGDTTVQTSRRPEIIKLWFMWIGRGKTGLTNHVKKIEDLKESLLKKMKARQDEFVPILKEFDLPLVSFYVVPKNVSGTDLKKISMESIRIQKDLIKKNFLFVSLSTLPKSEVNSSNSTSSTHPQYFLTISLTNSQLTEEDLDHILNLIKMAANQEQVEINVPKYKDSDSDEKFVNSPILRAHETFLKRVSDRIIEKGLFFKRSDNVTHFAKPEELLKIIDFSLPDQPMSHDKILTLMDHVIEYSPHWAHPYFIYQLAAGLDPYSIIAEILAPVLNSPMINHEDSPIFTLMENELLEKIRVQVFGSPKGDGIITDGGSMANQMAMQLAKYAKRAKMNNINENGIRGKQRFVLFISEDGHYSTKKGGIVQSLGSENIISVRADEKGQMDVADLRAKIQQSLKCLEIPYMVVITTGTTIYGAIDPVADIVAVCKEYDLWCHVDGMFGGFTVLSDQHKAATPGLEGVDSWGADVHKLLGSAYVCTVLITRHDDVMRNAFAVDHDLMSSDYPLKEDLEKSNGVKYMQSEKRNNMLKLWTMWKAKGRVGLGKHVDVIMKNSEYIVEELHRRKDRGFLPVLDKFALTNICFYYIPPYLRSMEVNSEEWKKAINVVSFAIETQLVKRNLMSIVSQSHHSVNGDTANFIKFVMMGSALTKEDIHYLLDVIEYVGKGITAERMGRSLSDHVSTAQYVERFDPFGNCPREDVGLESRFRPRNLTVTACRA